MTALGADKVTIEEVDVKNIFSGTGDGKFPGEISQITWNETSEKILMQVKRGENSEWGVINLKKVSESINLTQAILKYTGKNAEKKTDGVSGKQITEVKRNLTQVVISDATASRFVALIDGALREIDTSMKTFSEAYLKNIAKFKMSGSQIIYLTKHEKDKRQVGIYRLGDKGGIDVEVIVRSKKDAVVGLALSEFDSKKYLCVTIDEQLTIYRANEYPTYGNNDNNFEKISEEKLAFTPNDLVRSDNGEFFIARSDKKFMIYNLDLEELSYVDHQNSNISWLDNYLMFDVVDGRMEVFDFDGANRRTILSKNVAAGFDAVINSNNRYLYYVVKTDNGYNLQRDKLI